MEDQQQVQEFRLPDLGEGLADAELVAWAVAVGDTVALNQTLCEVETAKAQVTLPSPYAGTVLELLAQPGETVPVGAPLIRVASAAPASSTEAAATANTAEGSETASGEASAERQSVLVGYGPDREPVSRRARAAAAKTADAPANSGRAMGSDGAEGLGNSAPAGRPSATPAARKLAREIGIDLAAVIGTGPLGAVTVEDLNGIRPESLAGGHIPIHTPPPATSVAHPAPAVPPLHATGPRTTPAERETRTPIAGIRKRTAAAMVASAQHIPQASAFVTADFTASMELLEHLRSTPSFTGLTLTPLALVARATLAALTEFPELNSCWDEENQQIVTKHYVNLGIAVATERGLLVPNLKEAQGFTLRDLCLEIAGVAGKARGGTATPADLTGGTITLTNVGVFGVDYGVPLVNPGEAAILCLGSIRKRPWVHRDELAVRWVTSLGLSFDHRMIDGEQGARFLASVAALLEDPLTLLGRV
ncbi:2-oxo acid dehydrogenase subunit E2 [Nocardia yunnanensis]|uniref:Dihydrolipoamide acetyltransferase component of pyruvate dehydrogenase complex n=1 Tax=Nocardia yunnanensis TaxID=2382165 RepID=A0A386ZBI8_9NOCA|nr:dihydrolipoamide acetyltransferase family protein [Nocardia yunnanensis]AYF74990.1 2-oxo acid dehydrogenase subunit E2 [Nocardia yunnanensis]